MSLTKADVLNAMAIFKELMDAQNAATFATKAELDSIDGTADTSDLEGKIDVLSATVEGLDVFYSAHDAKIDELQSDVSDLKNNPNTEVEEITAADIAALFN